MSYKTDDGRLNGAVGARWKRTFVHDIQCLLTIRSITKTTELQCEANVIILLCFLLEDVVCRIGEEMQMSPSAHVECSWSTSIVIQVCSCIQLPKQIVNR